MKLVSLTIRRMPGTLEPFTLDELAPALNLVHGPNESGKTTFCRAVRALLWPQAEPGERVWVEARFERDDGDWRAEREGRTVRWQHQGRPADPPRLPPGHVATCFTVEADALLRLGDDEEQLAHEVLRQMAGGYDLHPLLADLEKKLVPAWGRGTREQRELREEHEAFERARSAHRALAEERNHLDEQREQRDAARRARDEAERLDAAIQLLETGARREELAADLERLGPVVARLRGDEASATDALIEQRDRLVERRRRLLTTCTTCETELAEAALPHGPLEEHEFGRRRRDVTALVRDEGELQRLRDEERTASVQLEQAREALAGQLEGEPRLMPEALARFEQAVKREEELSRRRAELAAAERILPRPRPDEELRRWRAGRDALRRWREARTAPGSFALLLVVLAALAAGASAVAAWWGDPRWGWLTLAATLGVLAAMFVPWRSGRRQRAQASEDLARAGLEPPPRWDHAAVAERMEELAAALVAEEARRLRAAEDGARLDEERRHLEELEAELAAEREALAREAGLAPSSSSLTLGDALRAVERYREAAGRLETARRDAAAATRAIEQALQRHGAFLAEHGLPAAEDAAALGDALDRLQSRSAQARQALAGLGKARTELADVETERGEKDASIAERYRELGLEPGDRAGIDRLLDQLPERDRLREALAETTWRVRDLKAKLTGDRSLLDLPLDELRERRRAAEAQAAHEDELREQVARVEAAIAQAKGGHDVEEALERIDRARAAVDAQREEARRAAAGATLLARTIEDHERSSRPPVLERAARWFAEFTGHRYRLDAHRDGHAPRFRAVDTTSGHGLALGELSTGTRTQLLLAARLAFAVEAEQGEELPLLLDEALGHSDPERFSAVARALAVLARERRQVFYLTCQPHDIGLWRRVLDEESIHERREIDLGRLRQTAAAADPGALALPPAARVPDPAGLTAAEYAEALAVPRVDPHAGAAALHLFYLLDDRLEILRELLVPGITRVGQWRSLAERAGGRVLLPRDEARRLDALAAAADTCLRAWCVGRPRPFTHDVLLAAEVSERWMPGLCALAEAVDWDGARLVARIEDRDERIKGMHKATARKIEAALEERGHLDGRAPLGYEQVLVRVMGEHAHAVDAAELRHLVDRLWWALAGERVTG
jgi:hypothetical protein